MVILHRVIAVLIAVAVATAAALVNDGLEASYIVLGAVVGLAHWYWRPRWPAL